MTLTLYVLPGCAPCHTVKEALQDPAMENYGPVYVLEPHIEDLRVLRKACGQRLVFPILMAATEQGMVAHRIGARTNDPLIERQLIIDWLNSLSTGGFRETGEVKG